MLQRNVLQAVATPCEHSYHSIKHPIMSTGVHMWYTCQCQSDWNVFLNDMFVTCRCAPAFFLRLKWLLTPLAQDLSSGAIWIDRMFNAGLNWATRFCINFYYCVTCLTECRSRITISFVFWADVSQSLNNYFILHRFWLWCELLLNLKYRIYTSFDSFDSLVQDCSVVLLLWWTHASAQTINEAIMVNLVQCHISTCIMCTGM